MLHACQFMLHLVPLAAAQQLTSAPDLFMPLPQAVISHSIAWAIQHLLVYPI